MSEWKTVINLPISSNRNKSVSDHEPFRHDRELILNFANISFLSRQMKEALSEIIQLATVDSEPWVLMVADILKSFPETGSLNLDLEEQNPNVQDILGELREKGRKCVLCVPSFSFWCGGRSLTVSEKLTPYVQKNVTEKHTMTDLLLILLLWKRITCFNCQIALLIGVSKLLPSFMS